VPQQLGVVFPMSRDSDNDLPPGGSSYVDSQSRRENLHRSVDGDKGRSGSSDGKKKPKSLRSIMDKNVNAKLCFVRFVALQRKFLYAPSDFQ